MTREDIIRMAREADIDCDTDGDIWGSTNGALLRFAALVAAAEREACAKVAEDRKDDCFYGEADYYEAERIAKAIRARGEE